MIHLEGITLWPRMIIGQKKLEKFLRRLGLTQKRMNVMADNNATSRGEKDIEKT